ncbi:MAG: MmgE/PrpD family protein, partial [Alphaproteobacteria bacterium]
LAVSFSSGLKANFGTMTKPLHIGQTNRNGLLAALLARDGFTANRDSFEHPQGFFEVFDGAGNYDAARIVPGFADPFNIVKPGLAIKSHPCCGSTHPAIDALLELRRRHGLDPENVDHILSWTHARRLTHTFRPDPKSALDAKFSIQYVLARALMHGQIKIEHFDAGAYDDADARAVMARITAEPHPAPGDISEEHFLAEVKVTTASGEVHSLALEEPVGRSSASPLPPSAVRDKFNDCAGRGLAADKVAALGDAVEALETLDDIRALTVIVADAGPLEETGAPASLSTAAG